MAKKAFKVSLIPALKNLQVFTKLLTTGRFIGQYKSSFRGKGLEFDSYRAYTPDDDAGLIDWKATARSDDVLVKNFIEERNVNVFILVDVSATMLYGSSATKLKMVCAAELAATLCYAVLKAQDNVGFGFFSDRLVVSAPLSLDPNQFYVLCRELSNPENYGGPYDIGHVLDDAFAFLPDKSVVFIISDFIGGKAGWDEKVKVAGKKFDVVGVMIRDVFDRTLPSDEVNLLVEHPLGGEQVLINPSQLKRTYELHAREEEDFVKSVFHRAGGDFILLSTDKSFVKPLMSFFKRRERMVR